MPYVKKRTAARKKVVRKRAPAKNTKLVKLIKKVASAQVHKQIEDKQHNLNYPLTTFNNSVNGIGDMLRILPYVSLGTDVHQRTGDTITARSLSLMGHIVVNPPLSSDPARSRIMVRMALVQPRQFGTYTNINLATAWLD